MKRLAIIIASIALLAGCQKESDEDGEVIKLEMLDKISMVITTNTFIKYFKP